MNHMFYISPRDTRRTSEVKPGERLTKKWKKNKDGATGHATIIAHHYWSIVICEVFYLHLAPLTAKMKTKHFFAMRKDTVAQECVD